MSNQRRSRIYLAAPLFNSRERDFNAAVAAFLEQWAEVFLPQRDGLLMTRLVNEGWSVDAARQTIYSRDVGAIEASDVLVAILDGRTIDEGVAFEVGYAKALGKTCVGYKSDDRVMLPTGDNPMILMACKHQCSTMDELEGIVCLVLSEIAGAGRAVVGCADETHSPVAARLPDLAK